MDFMEQHNVNQLCDVDTLGVIVLYSSENQDKCEDKIKIRGKEREIERCKEKDFDWEFDEGCWTEVKKN